jgi:hypothetical protein
LTDLWDAMKTVGANSAWSSDRKLVEMAAAARRVQDRVIKAFSSATDALNNAVRAVEYSRTPGRSGFLCPNLRIGRKAHGRVEPALFRDRGRRPPRAERHKTNSVMPTRSTTIATPRSFMRPVWYSVR